MDFKRKIACILLAGLILGLFASFSFLRSMETAVIKDFNGQIVQLDDTQRVALNQCETLRNLIQDTEGQKQEIPFDRVQAYITGTNLQRLANLIINKKYLEQIAQEGDCLELFKLANYMKAPDETIQECIYRIAHFVCAQLEKAGDSNESDSLEHLFLLIKDYVYPNLSSVIEGKGILWQELDPSSRVLTISYPRRGIPGTRPFLGLDKKLCSLDGIVALGQEANKEFKNQRWSQELPAFNIQNQLIRRFDIAEIKKAFPGLNTLNFPNNIIDKIDDGINGNDIVIDVRKNPIKSICINNPGSLKGVEVIVDADPDLRVTFNQTDIQKCATWFEAFRAQSKVALNRPGMWSETIHLAKSLAISNVITTLPVWLYLYKPKTINTQVIVSLINNYVSSLCVASAIWLPYQCIKKMWQERTKIKQKLDQLAMKQGPRVSVRCNDPEGKKPTMYYNFPSKYDYNLFGKN